MNSVHTKSSEYNSITMTIEHSITIPNTNVRATLVVFCIYFLMQPLTVASRMPLSFSYALQSNWARRLIRHAADMKCLQDITVTASLQPINARTFRTFMHRLFNACFADELIALYCVMTSGNVDTIHFLITVPDATKL